MPRDCPRCGLVNPDTASHCDCGYDFHGLSALHSVNVQGRLNMVIGALVSCIGIGMTAALFSVGVVVVFFIALSLGGIGLFFRGFSQYMKTRHY